MKRRKLTIKTLREQVYEYLQDALNRGELMPGSSFNLHEIGERLGISRTPLRFALHQLENEGFVEVLPCRGCVAKVLTLKEIRHIYQILGALESSVIRSEFRCITAAMRGRMRYFNDKCRAALEEEDYEHFYKNNLGFHDIFLGLSDNDLLKRTALTLKKRLYDFPRRQKRIKEWELQSTGEHERFIRLLESGDPRKAADYMRDVHWSFEVQERYIEQYYEQAYEKVKTTSDTKSLCSTISPKEREVIL